MTDMIEFQTEPSRYRHWRVSYEGDVARVVMDVDETGGLFDGYEPVSYTHQTLPTTPYV